MVAGIWSGLAATATALVAATAVGGSATPARADGLRISVGLSVPAHVVVPVYRRVCAPTVVYRAAPVYVPQPVYTPPTVVYTPAPVYAAPVVVTPAPTYYYPQPALRIGFGFGGHAHGGHWDHHDFGHRR